MKPSLEGVLVDLGVADGAVRTEVERLLARFTERYGAVTTFLASEEAGMLNQVVADGPSSLYQVDVGRRALDSDRSFAIPGRELSLPAEYADCELRAQPLRLSDGFVYARLCALFRTRQDEDFDQRFGAAAVALHRVLMIHNLRLRYGRGSFGKHAYWANDVLPDLQLAAGAGKDYGALRFALVPPVEYPPFWLRPEWIYTIANLGFWVGRQDWPPVTRIARFRIESFVVAGVGLDEDRCRRAAAAVAREMGGLLGPRPDLGSSGCSLEVRALIAADARELIEMGQARCIRELSHAPILWYGA